MADTENAAQAASNPAEAPAPMEVVQSEETTAKSNGAGDDGEVKWDLSKSGDKNDRGNDRDEQRNGDRRDYRGGRGRSQYPSSGFQKKKKHNTEFDDLPETDDPEQIRAQVEFYFSSQNLATDEHLFMELEGPKNRPVSLKHVTSFKRMRRFAPYTAIVNALRESKHIDLVDGGDFGQESIKLKEPLKVDAKPGDDEKEPSTSELFYRLKNRSSNDMTASAYVKNFGDEQKADQITLEQFFRPYGAVVVRKRRNDDGSWKGSVFVEFDTEDSQKQFLALDPKPKFNDNELITMSKKEYVEMKCKEKGIKPDWELTEQELAEKRQKQRGQNGNSRGRGGDRSHRGGGRGRGRGGRGGRGGFGGGRDRDRDRSPRRHRDRSGSDSDVDERDWKTRRDRFKQGKDDRATRGHSDKKERKDLERDAHGVPVVRDSRTESEIAAASNKRKSRDDEERAESPKKSKIEIKQDE